MTTGVKKLAPETLPDWVPAAARNYLDHTEAGETIRAIARRTNVHASTVLRQVRRLESLRDDPLIDDALRHLSGRLRQEEPAGAADGNGGMMERKSLPDQQVGAESGAASASEGGSPTLSAKSGPDASPSTHLSEGRIEYEAVRILRRLVEPGTVLAVARDMEMGVVVRDVPGAPPERIAVVERTVAEALALKDWIASADPMARIARYQATSAGRTALKQLLGRVGARTRGFSEAQAEFDMGRVRGASADDGVVRHMRTVLAESPLSVLARRRDKEGRPFLQRELVAAGERLREDFELAQAAGTPAMNWDRFLSAPADEAAAEDCTENCPETGPETGAEARAEPALEKAPAREQAPRSGAGAARDRVVAALEDLGPGLADVALRCCCFLEGLENLERRMGWSARSGKVVLRIALQRLHRHYLETQGRFGPRIG